MGTRVFVVEPFAIRQTPVAWLVLVQQSKSKQRSTIDRKGSSKTLINTGFLVNAISQRIMANKAFVGLLPGTINKDGEDVVNIGAVMEYSAAIKHPNGATNILPAIPFLHPVTEKYLEQIFRNYRDAVRSLL